MTVRVADDGAVHLEGLCPVEDAEPLLRHLRDTPGARVDVRACEGAHTAVIQILLATGAAVQGPAPALFLNQWIEPALLTKVL